MLAPELIESIDEIAALRDGQFDHYDASALQMLPHTHFQRGARQGQGVFEPGANLRVKPAIDAAVEEIRPRSRTPAAAARRRASRTSRPCALPCATRPRDDASRGSVASTRPPISMSRTRRPATLTPTMKGCRSLKCADCCDRLRHDQERGDPQARPDEHQGRDERAFQSCGDHVYHSVRCRQSSSPEQYEAQCVRHRADVERCSQTDFVPRCAMTSA